MLPKFWKKSFINGVFRPTKMRFCDECDDKILCDECKNHVNENKEFDAKLNLVKRQAPNHSVRMRPYYIEQLMRHAFLRKIL